MTLIGLLLLSLVCLLTGLPWFALIGLLSLLVFHASGLDPALLVLEFVRLADLHLLAAIPLLSLIGVMARRRAGPGSWEPGKGPAGYVSQAVLGGFLQPLAPLARRPDSCMHGGGAWIGAGLVAPAGSVLIVAALLSVLAPARAVSVQTLFAALLLPWLLVVVVGYRLGSTDGPGVTSAEFRSIRPPWQIALLVPLAGSIYPGWLSVFEAATIGLLAQLLALALRANKGEMKALPGLVAQAMGPVGVIIILLGLALPWAVALSDLGLSATAAVRLQHLAALSPAAPGVLLAVVWLLAGALIAPIPALIVLAPLIFPAALAAGMDVVQMAVLSLLGLALGRNWPGWLQARRRFREWLLLAAGLSGFALWPGLSQWLPGLLD